MRILIGAPVRQDIKTFKRYLKSLNGLNKEGLEVDYLFILHNSPELKHLLNESQYIEYQSNNDYVKTDSHHWSNENLKDVIIMKNHLLTIAKKLDYDYFFLIDSDILLHKNTLQHLIKQDKDIISEVFWTSWNIGEEEQPNAWIFDFYSFDNLETLKTWRNKNVFEVGGTGACILISKKVLTVDQIDYKPIKNISYSLWEDRAFCIRASVYGFKIYLDTHYPAVHLYR